MRTSVAIFYLCLLMALPAPTAAGRGPAQVEVRNPGGLHTTTFTLPAGTVSLHLPDAMAAGDTISGTVVVEPAGDDEHERQRNESVLSGLVIEIGSDPFPVATGGVTLTLPEFDVDEIAGEETPLLTIALRERGRKKPGRTLAATDIPYLRHPPLTAAVFMLPAMGQTGRTIRVRGALDGDLANTGLNVGDRTALPLAESPRQAIFRAPADITGSTELELLENGRTLARSRYRNVAVALSAPKTRLQRGETTTLSLTVSGLAGLDRSVPVIVEIHPAGVLTMRGGNRQEFTIVAAEVDDTGVAHREFQLTGNRPGAWDGIATVRTEPVLPRRYGVTLGQGSIGLLFTGAGRNPGLPGWFERMRQPGAGAGEPLHLVVTPAIAAALAGEVAAAPPGDKSDATRQLFELEPDGQVQAILEFPIRAVDRVTLPALDTTSKEPAYMTVDINTDQIKYKKGSGKTITGMVSGGTRLWSSSNFQIEIGDLPCSGITRIGSFTWNHGADTGRRTLTITNSMADFLPWRNWHRTFVIDGKCDAASTLDGSLQLYPPDRDGEPVRMGFTDACVTALKVPAADAAAPGQFEAELSVGGMTIHPPLTLRPSLSPGGAGSRSALQPVLDRIQRTCLRAYSPDLLRRLTTERTGTIPTPVDAYPGSQWDFLDTNAGVDKGTFYPTLLETLAPALARHLSPGDRFLDLGSGDGRMVFLASHLGARATGMEFDSELIRISLEAMEALAGTVDPDTIRFLRGDFFESSWSGYDVIYYFGRGSSERDRLGEKLAAEMDPGARLIVLHEEKPYRGLVLLEETESVKVYRQPPATN